MAAAKVMAAAVKEMAAMEEASPLSRIEHPIRSYRLADPRFPRLRRLLLEGVPTAH